MLNPIQYQPPDSPHTSRGTDAFLSQGGLAHVFSLPGGSKTEFAVDFLHSVFGPPPLTDGTANPAYAFFASDEGTFYPVPLYDSEIGRRILSRLLIVRLKAAEEVWKTGLEAVQTGLFQQVFLRPSRPSHPSFLSKLQIASEKTRSRIFLLSQAKLPHWVFKTSFEVQPAHPVHPLLRNGSPEKEKGLLPVASQREFPRERERPPPRCFATGIPLRKRKASSPLLRNGSPPVRVLYLESKTNLTQLTEACLAVTPDLSLPDPQSLYLFIHRTEKCLGGEARVLEQVDSLLEQFGIQAKRVLTDAVAWAKPLAIHEFNLYPKGKSPLSSLAIDRIRVLGDPQHLEDERSFRLALIHFMSRIGLKTIHDFLQLSTQALIRRFGKQGLKLREWALERECLLPPWTPSETITEKIQADGICDLEGLLFYLRSCLVRIEARLVGRGLAARTLTLYFSLEGSAPLKKVIELSDPMVEAKYFLRWIKETLSTLTWSGPLETLTVEVTEAVPRTAGQLSLFDCLENRSSELSEYVQRLQIRYGKEACGFSKVQESFIPENSYQLSWPLPVAASSVPSLLPSLAPRPYFLFTPPRPLATVKGFTLTPSESVTGPWWEPGRNSRQYFVANTPDGEKLWVFFDLGLQRWFLHGCFD